MPQEVYEPFSQSISLFFYMDKLIEWLSPSSLTHFSNLDFKYFSLSSSPVLGSPFIVSFALSGLDSFKSNQ